MKTRRSISLNDSWFLHWPSPTHQPWMRHSCELQRLWSMAADAQLPPASSGPHFRNMPYDPLMMRFWCLQCGEIASEENTFMALLAGAVATNRARPKDFKGYQY